MLNWKRTLGLDNLSDEYAFGRNESTGYTFAKKIPDHWVATTCGYCSVGCGIEIGVKDGKAVASRPHAAHPVNRAKLCPKGLSEHYTIGADNRARHPLLRKSGKLARVDWDEALTVMADRFRATQAAHGPASLGVLSTGQLVTEEFYTLGKLVQLGLGTNNFDGNTTLCMATAVSGYKISFGSDGPPGAYEDLEQADVILLIGANLADNHPILCQYLEANRNKTLIVADPRVTKTAMMADLHLPLKPRSDLALLNGIAHVLIRCDLINREYIEKHTTGFAELEQFLEACTPERTAEITGLSQETILKVALLYGRAKAGFIGWTMGVNHSTLGTATVNAICNLALLTGHIGRPGAAPFSITGQCNAMGTREAGFASSLPGYRKFENADDRRDLAAIWGVEESLIPTKRGLAYPDIIEATVSKKIRALWIIATNPLVSYPNQEVLRQGLSNLDFLVVQDGYHPTPTTELADLVLPAAIWGEKDGTYTNSERRVSKANKAVDPPGEARSDFDIFLGLAEKLGCRDTLFPGWHVVEDAFDEWRRVSEGRLCDYSGIGYSMLAERHAVQWPLKRDELPAGTTRLYADGQFKTESGKANLLCAAWVPFPEQPGGDYPFILNTGRTVEHWHTRTKTKEVPILERLSPRAWLEMNPRDAKRMGLRSHDAVDVVSRRGRVREIELRLTEIIAPGQVFMPFHFAETNVNEVTQDIFRPHLARAELQAMRRASRALRTKRMKQQLVVIGNGMAGVSCVEQILKQPHDFDITIFGDETHANYNRILLSLVLAGEKSAGDIVLNDIDWYQTNQIRARLGVKISHVDRDRKVVVDEEGVVTSYDKLILATGSRPVIPAIPGVDKKNVHVFRTLDDTRALLEKSRQGLKVVVIGGGLLGLEAARGLQVRGCDVTVVHLRDKLMDRQLDATGADYLKRKIESLGIRVLLPKQTAALYGNGSVDGLRFASGEELEAELVVIAAGILPNAELGRKAGLDVRRGIIVNDYMQTSDPHIFAVGECTEHRGQTFGLVAPLFEQGRVLASFVAGDQDCSFAGAPPATKLKIMGVDIFSAGSIDESEQDVEAVRYEDPSIGVYRKVLLKNNRLHGVILVGDTEDESVYQDWLRTGTDLSALRRQVLFPPRDADPGLAIAEMPDTETICGCNGVRKGDIIQAIHKHGIATLQQLKERTRASTSCGTCTGLCEKLLKAVTPDFREETKTTLCSCLPFSYEQLRDIVRGQQLKSVGEVLNVYGNRKGCEVCKPALSYLLDMLWCGSHEEDRSARFINDRVHANIQKDGTFSVVPRMRGGVTTPDELRRIADVADKYKVPMVKVTGSQRIDLLGIKKADLPKVWADLGMPSGQAYTKGVRMVKTCVGTEFCRFGVQDSTNAGIELERRLENLFTPHKYKMGVVGCPRNCAEATVKDLGMVGQDGSWQIVVGGAAGKSVRKADLLITVETTEQALEASDLFFQYYRENANYLERTYDFVERLGIEKIRKETVYAPDEERASLLDRLSRSKAMAKDAWLEGASPVNPTQFVQIRPLETATA